MKKDKTALFVGKFQPPHLGHITTIMNQYGRYEKIIVGVTEGEPRVMSLEETCDILQNIFKYLPKVEIYPIKNTLDDESAIPYLPKGWDVLLSGNDYILKLCKKHGWNCKYIPRSKGIGYSGTELRSLTK